MAQLPEDESEVFLDKQPPIFLSLKKGSFRESLQLAFLSVGLFSLLILYGILQEKIMTTDYSK